MKINYIIYYIDIQYNKYDYVVLLNYMPTSGEIQSAASDKISHSRVC